MLFQFLRFRVFRRPQIATFAEHDRVTSGVVDLFRMPVEEELCGAEAPTAPAAAVEAAPVVQHAPVRSGHLAA